MTLEPFRVGKLRYDPNKANRLGEAGPTKKEAVRRL